MAAWVAGSEKVFEGTALESPVRGELGEIGEASPPWHAVYTRHQHEKITARLIEFKGFEVFLPLYNTAHRWKDRTKKLSLPLFPCYVFFRGPLSRQLEILSTPGVHSLVRCGGQIALVPDEEIQIVRRVIRSSAQAEPHPFLRCGDRVRVKWGPLTGIEGILVRKRDQFRLILSVELLQRSIAVEIEAAAVEVVTTTEVKSGTELLMASKVPGLQTA